MEGDATNVLYQDTFKIHHLHTDHNVPCLTQKFCSTIVFDFSWDDGNTQTMVLLNFGDETKWPLLIAVN